MNLRNISMLAVCAGTIVAPAAQASCSSSVCSINTGAEAQGLSKIGQSRLDIRFEFIDQNQPRAGSRDIALGEIRRHHDEVRTINRNLIAALDHRYSAAWGVTVQAPLINRTHDHNHNHHGAVIPEQWSFTKLGDARVLGRYYFSEDESAGSSTSFNFGLKLPTGSTGLVNADGDQAERSLQPGSGSTDGLLGVSYYRPLASHQSSAFASALWQKPVTTRGNYKPGARMSLDLGLRHSFTGHLTALLQLNTQWRGRDHGLEAEPGLILINTPPVSPGSASNPRSRPRHWVFNCSSAVRCPVKLWRNPQSNDMRAPGL